ncbi:uncharacterized protein LOC133531474 [Cydia pomonella]|uniref:uncharacterized protein LOC133531474 n=1 Tax=Cydia pomonella TaxID=82600 RepID=UPI002ADE1FD3|nr:uncharacterized protein LOC133531474 [Cydia pomonella]
MNITCPEVVGGESWRGVARSPSRESVTTDLSLFSVSSAASDARALRLLACKAGQGPDPNLRVASPHPESKLQKRPSSGLPLQTADACKSLLAGCAALCAALGLRRSLSADDVTADKPRPPRRYRTYTNMSVQTAGRLPLQTAEACKSLLAGCAALCAALGLRRSLSADDVTADKPRPPRSATSEVGLCAALEALTLSSASRSCSTWVAVGGSQLPSPQRASVQPAQRLLSDNKKIRQNYIKRRLLTTYKALERMSQSEFNLDKLEAAAVASALASGGGAGPTVLAVPAAPTVPTVPNVPNVPTVHTRFVHPEACALALTAADLERERGRPLSKYERNMMIFNWLHTLDDQAPF